MLGELEQLPKPNIKGKRVLMVIENSPYLVDVRVKQEALTLTSAGYSVFVICPVEKGGPVRMIVDGVHVYCYPEPPSGSSFLGYMVEYGFSLLSIFYLSLIIGFSYGFDYLHTANPPDIIVLIGAFYKLLGKRFVFDQHDLAPEIYKVRFQGNGNRVVYKALLLFEKMSCKLADHIITTNESSKQIDIKRNNVPEEHITVVRNGPDAKMLQHIEPDTLLRKEGIFSIVYVGKISDQDGLDYLIRALCHLKVDLKRKDFHCYVLGNGSALKDIQSMAVDTGLEDYITFTGWVVRDVVHRYISSADICVTPDPSNEYNDRCTMVKMMEYMAFGKPIVAFDLPEHRVSAGEAALYAHPNDELDFAMKIAELMDDPERRKRMGEIGRLRVVEELAWPHQEAHLLKAYEALNS